MKKRMCDGFTTADSLIGLTIIVMFSLLYSEVTGVMNQKIDQQETQMQKARTAYELKQSEQKNRFFNDR
ncbi:type II secretion system protein [Lentilactobacillus senioris]|uniref:type II secretion system protein n=1 Tax=Lentilactobacillus senioris TaxID=931534 RepID=UPI00227F2CCF|nr:type II secretion system protein [Lentilactobacillus senioris]MCY9806727.1 type II secretion system protein [Lentilactobacillus senioris]